MKHSFALLLILLVLTSSLPLTGHSAEEDMSAKIGDIIITTSDSHLLLFAAVKNGLSGAMLKGVRNGIPVTFRFFIELEQVKNNWLDTVLVKHTIQHTLSYDTLKEEYIINFTEGKPETIVTESVEKAKEVMVELSGVQVLERSRLIPEAQYLLHIKATLAEKTLPLNMHNIVPFISLWDLETDWHTIEFKY